MIDLVDVAPRDGLQNETVEFSTEQKLELIRRIVATGVKRVEATAFVSPRAVPRMADADEVCAGLDKAGRFSGLVVNPRGFERLAVAGLGEVNVVVVASEELSQRNQGCSTADAIANWKQIAPAARAAGIRPTVTVAAFFGCPFSGEVDVARVVDVVERTVEAAEPVELIFADTIGVGVPADVTERVRALRTVTSAPLRAHFHDTRRTALGNVAAAIEEGVTAFDASLGGIGGCPFAPGATGNVATEDVVWLFGRMGLETGIDLDALLDASRWLSTQLGRDVPSAISRAGAFPK